jgi:electron transfer flavoprotein beta subunit
MKVLVAVKRVVDYNVKIRVKADKTGVETANVKFSMNPFDEIAVEEAVRLKEAGKATEVVVVSMGPAQAQETIRTALAMGADRAIHVLADGPLDPFITAAAVQKVVSEEKPDLVILGKQAIDDDMGQMGIILADRLGWGQATFASKETSLESDDEKNKVAALRVKDGRVEVVREVDGGIETLSVALPAIVTTELRLNVPRYASLPGIMKAKKKEIKERKLSELTGGAEVRVKVVKMEPPAQRKAGIIVPDVATLVQKLRSEAKVI